MSSCLQRLWRSFVCENNPNVVIVALRYGKCRIQCFGGLIQNPSALLHQLNSCRGFIAEWKCVSFFSLTDKINREDKPDHKRSQTKHQVWAGSHQSSSSHCFLFLSALIAVINTNKSFNRPTKSSKQISLSGWISIKWAVILLFFWACVWVGVSQ